MQISINISLAPLSSSPLISLLLLLLLTSVNSINGQEEFTLKEATIDDIQRAFTEKTLTSRQLVDLYLRQIETLNPVLRGVIEVNPDARHQADEADRERERNNINKDFRLLGDLHGIPVLLKDSIATKDKLNTTVGSYALLGSEARRDATVVERLRSGGAIIMGKASLSEWYHFRSFGIPDGWSARGGQSVNPYVHEGNPCGSSSGSAISVAANMVAVSLGTETDGSILCPADYNSVVGIKPTVGLTSRAGVVPMSPRQDTIGPIGRTVADAVQVLDTIVGFDPRDFEATKEAAKFIPSGGYKQFLNKDGLKGKRLGVVRNPFLTLLNRSTGVPTFEHHLNILRQCEAIVVDDLEIANVDVILDRYQSGETVTLLAEFKLGINEYLKKELISSPVRSLSDVIAFNSNNPDLYGAYFPLNCCDHVAYRWFTLKIRRQCEAIVVDDLEIANVDVILDRYQSGETVTLLAEFKLGINEYLKEELISSPVRSLSDVIAFNSNNPDLEKTKEYGQEMLIAAELTTGIGKEEREAIGTMENLSRDGIEKLMKENELDALVTPGWAISPVLAIGGYPAISVPAGYDSDGMPFGICFGGLKGTEPTLIEIAYAFERATKIRKSPSPFHWKLTCDNVELMGVA